MSAATYTATGSKAATSAKLDPSVFGIDTPSHELLKQAYLAHDANSRQNLARTKTRGLVSGGGKKPWKQKGTGRARFGSSRVPIWRGGGVVFGPTGNENYSIKMHTAAKQTALRQALSMKALKDAVTIVEDVTFKNGKTSEAVALLAAIKVSGNTLVVVDKHQDSVSRAFANLSNVQIVTAKYLSVYTVMNADHIVVSKPALTIIHEWLAVTKPADKPVAKAEKKAPAAAKGATK